VSATGWGYDAFISYGRRDATHYAAALWARLDRAGLNVALDRHDLNPGDRPDVSATRETQLVPPFARHAGRPAVGMRAR
jgi:hypothetical protein